MNIVMDELGRFWLENGNGVVFAGPYETPEEAEDELSWRENEAEIPDGAE